MADVQFTYADPTFPLPKRALIRAIETMTGQPRLKRLYLENRRNPVPGESFFAAAVRKLELDVQFDAGRLSKLPATGPVVVVANHPYGVLDGLVIGWLVEKIRSDFLILTNAVLLNAPDVNGYLLPVDFAGTPEALKTNIRTRAIARDHLDRGGCIIVFPAGAVSTSPDKLGLKPALDGPWQPFTAQLIQRSRATVMPLFFGGQNSRLFQIASHINVALRLSLIFKEVRDRIGTALPVVVGDPISFEAIERSADRKAIAEHLMRHTYQLGEALPPRRRSLIKIPPTLIRLPPALIKLPPKVRALRSWRERRRAPAQW
jgi:putative hemolysin